MLATVLVLSLCVVAFWKSLFRLLIAALLVLLLVGGVQAVQAIGAIINVGPTQSQCTPPDQNKC